MHHERVELSTVATRDRTGIWTVSGVGQRGGGLAKVQDQTLPPYTLILTADESRALDRLLASKTLRQGPRYSFEGVEVGAASTTLEIEGRGRRLVMRWDGTASPSQAAIRSLLFPKREPRT